MREPVDTLSLLNNKDGAKDNQHSTQPHHQNTTGYPKHVAIIMDGNGRWASHRHLPRMAGHRAGVDMVKESVMTCIDLNIDVLTLFAFSSENWRRPAKEVDFLMNLFSSVLEREAKQLQKNNVQLRIIGDRKPLNKNLVHLIETVESLTQNNTGLKLILSTNYGGRWDIVQAAQKLAHQVKEGTLNPNQITEAVFQNALSLSDLPEPDLFIRTSGEIRISNFLIWQLAYTEMYFTDILWPDFDRKALEMAFVTYAKRQRRYGTTGEQYQHA